MELITFSFVNCFAHPGSEVYDGVQVLMSKRIRSIEDMDCVLANDEQLMHGVSPIQVASKGEEAYRDMLIMMFTRV